jgi:hypothetical protein
VTFEALLRPDVAEQLRRLRDIRLFQLKVRAPWAATLALTDQDLASTFQAAARAGEADEVELILRPQPHSRRALAGRLLAATRRVFGLHGLHEKASRFVVRGFDRDTGKVETLDLLSDQLISKQLIVLADERSRALNRESAFTAIEAAHADCATSSTRRLVSLHEKRHRVVASALLLAELGTALACLAAFILWMEGHGGRAIVDEVLRDNQPAIYSALASIFGSLLGFVIATVAIVVAFDALPRLRVVRESADVPDALAGIHVRNSLACRLDRRCLGRTRPGPRWALGTLRALRVRGNDARGRSPGRAVRVGSRKAHRHRRAARTRADDMSGVWRRFLVSCVQCLFRDLERARVYSIRADAE